MTALVIPPAAILADIARRGGDIPPAPHHARPHRSALQREFLRLLAVGVDRDTARTLTRYLRARPYTPAVTDHTTALHAEIDHLRLFGVTTADIAERLGCSIDVVQKREKTKPVATWDVA